jgi:uncharacterized protein YndB with AHSA1/START domain
MWLRQYIFIERKQSMKIHEVKLHQEFAAPVEQVWEAFSDHENFGRMMGQKVLRIADSADPSNVNGVGSVRRLRLPTGSFEETIIRSERPALIEYQITRGTPLHHHYGRMRFSSLGSGRSAIDYSIEIGSKYPLIGLIVKNALQKALGDGLKAYARRLEKSK